MVASRKSFMGCLMSSFKAFKVNRLCLSFNRGIINVKATSLINDSIDVVFNVFIMDFVYLFMSY